MPRTKTASCNSRGVGHKNEAIAFSAFRLQTAILRFGSCCFRDGQGRRIPPFSISRIDNQGQKPALSPRIGRNLQNCSLCMLPDRPGKFRRTMYDAVSPLGGCHQREFAQNAIGRKSGFPEAQSLAKDTPSLRSCLDRGVGEVRCTKHPWS